MPLCPSCQAEIDPEADLCLGCGEPLGDSPAARTARADASAAKTATPPAAPASGSPADEPFGIVRPPGREARPTLPARPKVIKRTTTEPEPVRCPGCGVPSLAARCPGCGRVLRHS